MANRTFIAHDVKKAIDAFSSEAKEIRWLSGDLESQCIAVKEAKKKARSVAQYLVLACRSDTAVFKELISDGAILLFMPGRMIIEKMDPKTHKPVKRESMFGTVIAVYRERRIWIKGMKRFKTALSYLEW